MTSAPLTTLAHSLLRRFSLTILACLLVFGVAFNMVVVQPAGRALAERALEQSAGQVQVELAQDIRSVESLLQATTDWARGGRLNLGDPEGFVETLIPLLRAHGRIAGALLADQDGGEIFLVKDQDAWRSRLTTPGTPGQ